MRKLEKIKEWQRKHRDEMREYAANYRKKNHEMLLAKSRAYYSDPAHRNAKKIRDKKYRSTDEFRKKRKSWPSSSPEKRREAWRRYYEANKEKVRARDRARSNRRYCAKNEGA